MRQRINPRAPPVSDSVRSRSFRFHLLLTLMSHTFPDNYSQGASLRIARPSRACYHINTKQITKVFTVVTFGKTPGTPPPVDISTLLPALAAVRTNCHISDATHATDYTLCVYLLKMREYFRWENDIPFNAALPHRQLTSWLAEREEHWDSLQGQSYMDIPVNGSHHDPFILQLSLSTSFSGGIEYSVRSASDHIKHVHTRLLSCSPAITIQNYQNRIERLQQHAHFQIKSVVQQHKSRLSTLASTLNAISPLQTLSRGYSITTTTDGQAITNTDSVSQNELIKTRLHIGQLVSRVEKIIKD